MTTALPARAVPAFRRFAVRVARVQRLGESFRRITLTGSDLSEFASGGYDQRIKVLLPLPDSGLRDCPTGPDWYAQWRALPIARRNPMRTYTVRAARPAQREVDIDFVLHGSTGPASAWAARARPDDEIVLVGPNRRFPGAAGGVEWRPPAGSRHLLLAGDETAVPAISAIAEALPIGIAARVLLEVPTDADILDLSVPPGVRLTWLPRKAGTATRPRGVLLSAAVRDAARDLGDPAPGAGTCPEPDAPDEPLWDVPADVGTSPAGAFAWLAGEAGVVTALRRHLLTDLGLDRSHVAFMGYWRHGRAQQG